MKKIEIRLFFLCHFNIYNVVVKLFFANAKLNKNNYRNKFFVKKSKLEMRKKCLRLFWMALFVGFVDFPLLTILVYFSSIIPFFHLSADIKKSKYMGILPFLL